MERVENERNQAEGIKVRRTRRGPASQQYIQPDAKIDQANQAQPVVRRPLCRNRNQHHIHRHRLPYQGIRSLRPGAHTIQFAGSSGCIIYRMLANRGELITHLDPRTSSRAASLDSVSRKLPVMLDPPNSVLRNLKLAFGLKVNYRRKPRQPWSARPAGWL